MATLYQDGDRIALSQHDIKILIALLEGESAAYQIGSRCQEDEQAAVRMSNGTLLPALQRLRELSFIAKSKRGLFKITDIGRQVLQWELDRIARLIELAEARTQHID